MNGRVLTQRAPWPTALEEAIDDLSYLDGWKFSLEDIARDYADAARTDPIAWGLTFVIFVPCHDSYHPNNYRPVQHYHPVPAATFNRQSWERWLFDRLMDTIRHEAAEWFRFIETTTTEDDEFMAHRRPFAPTHGPGDDPYVLHEYATDEQRATSYRGEVDP
jgi:hypothetical protein